MAATPLHSTFDPAALRLDPFEPQHAERVAGWVQSSQEAYFVAPSTTAPITADKVLAWRQHGRRPQQLAPLGGRPPIAYGELNDLVPARGEYWLGHLLVDPGMRGRGVGLSLVERLLRRGFERLAARRIVLVVFADNEPAIRCYRAAGLRPDGWETHRFPIYGKSERLMRFVATRPGTATF